MKRIRETGLVCLGVSLLLLIGSRLLTAQNQTVIANNHQEDDLINNPTVQIMIGEWSDNTREEIDAYFHDLADDHPIIALDDGGFVFYEGGYPDYDPYEEGLENPELYDFKGPRAATVGQVKSVLYKIVDGKSQD